MKPSIPMLIVIHEIVIYIVFINLKKILFNKTFIVKKSKRKLEIVLFFIQYKIAVSSLNCANRALRANVVFEYLFVQI